MPTARMPMNRPIHFDQHVRGLVLVTDDSDWSVDVYMVFIDPVVTIAKLCAWTTKRSISYKLSPECKLQRARSRTYQ
jgi:hypothetical protein